jgi:hypothetical protein
MNIHIHTNITTNCTYDNEINILYGISKIIYFKSYDLNYHIDKEQCRDIKVIKDILTTNNFDPIVINQIIKDSKKYENLSDNEYYNTLMQNISRNSPIVRKSPIISARSSPMIKTSINENKSLIISARNSPMIKTSINENNRDILNIIHEDDTSINITIKKKFNFKKYLCFK